MNRPSPLAILAFVATAACGSQAGGTGTPVTLLDYQARVPATFVSRPPTSSMRLAEFSVPRTDGTSAEVLVFYFGEGEGGSVEANIARWNSQFTGPDGVPVTPRVGALDGAEFPTTIAEFAGTYARGMGAGPGAAGALPDQGLVAAVVETARGSLFFQLVGDGVAVTDAREDFLDFVGSVASGS